MQIQFLPMNKKLEVPSGTSLLQAALDCQVNVEAVCAGNGTCGKCKMLVTKGNLKDYDDTEKVRLTGEELSGGMRLACRMKIYSDCCAIIPNESRKKQVSNQSNIKITEELEHSNKRWLSNHYGVTFDIGTTSVEACLFDLVNDHRLVQISTSNPQSSYGADVISRISYSILSDDNLLRLQKLIWDCCNELIDQLLIRHGILSEEILKSKSIEDVNSKNLIYNRINKYVILGNTTMSHIFLGKSVKGLARVPFEGIYYDMHRLSNEAMQFHMDSKGEIIVLPGIHGHVGSDTLGCIITTDLGNQKGINLLIDIGTNGEMVISHDNEMICCSTAAGPAFEGASIYHGMRAKDGAIKGFKIENNNVLLEVVGDTKPEGICGSGIIDVIAELIKVGIIDETGRLLTPEEVDSPLSSRIINENGMQFILAYSQNGQNIVLTQQDIREVQLAKAAIYAGTISLLKEVGVQRKDINRLYLAGAFGSNININNAIMIGLLPDIDRNRIKLIGNGSLDGGAMVLLSKITIEEATSIGKNINHIELANDDKFRRRYIDAINFTKNF